MNTQLPLNQRIDKTKLEKHPSGDGWLVPMRNGEKAQVFCFIRNGHDAPIIGLNQFGHPRVWYPDGRLHSDKDYVYDLMLDAYIDPYAELKAAHAAGKVIQARGITFSHWQDCIEGVTNIPLWLDGIEYRIKPDWTLGRSVNGFTLGDGQEWHRQDFTEDMLPDGWRPLLLGESKQRGDEVLISNVFMQCTSYQNPATKDEFHRRTRRPLPEVKKPVPLGPEDITPGSVIRGTATPESGWIMITTVGTGGVIAGQLTTYEEMKSWNWQISRDGGKTWEACSK